MKVHAQVRFEVPDDVDADALASLLDAIGRQLRNEGESQIGRGARGALASMAAGDGGPQCYIGDAEVVAFRLGQGQWAWRAGVAPAAAADEPAPGDVAASAADGPTGSAPAPAASPRPRRDDALLKAIWPVALALERIEAATRSAGDTISPAEAVILIRRELRELQSGTAMADAAAAAFDIGLAVFNGPEPPPYNHTRSDSPRTPCPECAAMEAAFQQAIANERRRHDRTWSTGSQSGRSFSGSEDPTPRPSVEKSDAGGGEDPGLHKSGRSGRPIEFCNWCPDPHHPTHDGPEHPAPLPVNKSGRTNRRWLLRLNDPAPGTCCGAFLSNLPFRAELDVSEDPGYSRCPRCGQLWELYQDAETMPDPEWRRAAVRDGQPSADAGAERTITSIGWADVNECCFTIATARPQLAGEAFTCPTCGRRWKCFQMTGVPRFQWLEEQ